MKAQGATVLDGSHPPGARFLDIDQEPAIWQRIDPCPHIDYISINELVSQNNLRIAEWYIRVLAKGGDLDGITLRKVEDCVNDARHAYYVAEHVRDCGDNADTRNVFEPHLTFGERRKAQGVRNRKAFFAADSMVDLEEHIRDEILQVDAVDWLDTIHKPLPPPPPHEGTPVIPGEFTKFPVFPYAMRSVRLSSPKKVAQMPDAVTTPTRQSPGKHRRNNTPFTAPGFHPESYVSSSRLVSNSPPSLTRSTSEAAGLGIFSPRHPNLEFKFPALPPVDESGIVNDDLGNVHGSPERHTTWADLAVNLPKSISVPDMVKKPMTPHQKRMLEDYRAKNPKKPYISLAEREIMAQEQKVPNHVRLARSRTDSFSPKKRETEKTNLVFTPKTNKSQPSRKSSVDEASNLHHRKVSGSLGPSTPSRKTSQAEAITPTKKSVDRQTEPENPMGPPKFYTHKRNNGNSKSSPQPRDAQPRHLADASNNRMHARQPSSDSTKSRKMAQAKTEEAPSQDKRSFQEPEDRSSKGSFTYTHEHEEALVAGGFIPRPPPVPEKSPLCGTESLAHPQYDGQRLKRVESSRNLSPERMKPTDTIGRREGHRIAKSVTTFNLGVPPIDYGLTRSETVPDNLQEASANVLEVPDVPAIDHIKEENAIHNPVKTPVVASIEDAAKKPAKKSSDLGYRDTLQFKKDEATPKKQGRLTKEKPVGERPESPSKKKRVVESMQMFNPSNWSKETPSPSKVDGTTSPSKRGPAASPSKDGSGSTGEKKDITKHTKKQTFEDKKPFLKAMWENMRTKVHKSKPSISSIPTIVEPAIGLQPSGFMISCEPTFQATLYSQLELLLATLANRFLLEEYNADRVSRTQATSYVERWVNMGRAQFTEFNCGQPFQALIVWELKDQLMFFGTYDRRLRDATLGTWQTNAREMAVKTGCMGDSAMQKHLQDSWKVLELLGGTWDDFEALSKLHISFHDMVAAAKKRNDALGIPHDWNPEPVPKTPAVGTLIRTPMLK